MAAEDGPAEAVDDADDGVEAVEHETAVADFGADDSMDEVRRSSRRGWLRGGSRRSLSYSPAAAEV